MKFEKPIVSVIMPVYNGDQFLDRSIKSVLNQTFNNFEYIIINDGSTDDSQKIIESYKDSRIKLINYSKNMGISFALNNGLNVAEGNYIARQDQDDVSFPDRFMLQIEFLENNNNIDLVDTNFIFIDENDKYIHDYEKRYFRPDETLSHLFFYEMGFEST